MSLPVLRFPEFEGEWRKTPLCQVLSERNDQAPKNDHYPLMAFVAHKGVSPKGDRYNRDFLVKDEDGKKYKRTEIGDFIYSSNNLETGSIGSNTYGPASISPVYSIFKIKEHSDHNFMHGLLTQKAFIAKMIRFRQGVVYGQWRIHESAFLKIEVRLPSLPEQKKIAAFLGVVDAKIAALRARRDGLERYKRGLMQALFRQTLRFTKPGASAFPDWEEKRLGEVFERVTRKNVEDNQNVLTISAQQGLVNQRDYFNKSVSAQDVSGYYLLHKGDFAYNKSYSKGYPMGAIKRLNMYEKGVVSTLYICFRTKGETTARFYEQFFEFGGLNREIHKIAQEGARNHGLLNMSVVEFFKDMIIPYPHPDEQAKIAEALSAMDAKIAAVGDQVAKMEAFKKGLLQQMFV